MGAMVVEDNEDIRRLVCLLVDLTEGAEIVAEARDAGEAMAQWRAHHPDVVVLDYRLPDRNGLEVAEQILAESPDTPILLFSAFLDDTALARAEALGIRECLSKDEVRRVPGLLLQYGHTA